MPRKTGVKVPTSVDEISYKGLTPIVDKIEEVSADIAELQNVQEWSNEELKRIRRADELILGQEVEDTD